MKKRNFGKRITFKDNIYAQYLLWFLIFYLLVFSPFILYGKTYLWSSDGMSQHYPSLLYTREWVYNIVKSLFEEHVLDIPNWNIQLGFGQDVFGNAINFRLFNFLYVFFGDLPIDFYLQFRTMVSLFLCGLAFISFAKTKSSSKSAILLGTLVYLFSGFVLYFSTRHAFFLEMMFFFPLMLIGVDNIFEKKKSYLFIAVVFLCGISYFYFLFMITLPAVIYALFRYFEINKKGERSIKQFFNTVMYFFWQYALGLLFSAFSLLPSLIKMFSSSRTGAQKGVNYLHWDLSYYLDFIKGIIDIREIGLYGFIALPGIALLAILYMFFSKNKKKRFYLGQLAIYTLTFLSPFLVAAFNGFAGKTQRWCYIFIFWAAMIVIEMFPNMLERNQKILNQASICLGIYLIIYTLIDDTKSSAVIFLTITLIVLVVLNCRTVVLKQSYVYLLLTVVLCVEMTSKSYDLYSPEGGNYIADFADKGSIESAAENNASTALNMIDDDSLYRVDVATQPLSRKYNQMNYGLRNYVNGISSYYSFTDRRICDYSLDLGNSQQNISFLILDWDQRTILNELAAVKYLATTDTSNNKIPYGYELIDSREKMFSDGSVQNEYLYRNNLALPMMYVYDSYISASDYEKLKTNEKEWAMLQGGVLEEDIDYPKTDLKFDYKMLLDKENILKQLEAFANEHGTVEVQDNSIIVKEDNVEIPLELPVGFEGEVYWIMDEAGYKSVNFIKDQLEEQKQNMNRYDWQLLKKENKNWKANDSTSFSVSMGSYMDNCTILNNTHQYYLGDRNYLLNLGYVQTQDSLTVKFGKAGKYSFKDLRVVCQPMDQYDEFVQARQQEKIDGIEIEGNTIKGKINNIEEKMVCISVPYSNGWKAFVNGKETKIYPTNGMYMAVMVEPGNNEIYLEYTTPGFRLGCIISGVSFLALIVTGTGVWISKKMKRKGEKL